MPIYTLVEGSGISSDPTGPKLDYTQIANGIYKALVGNGSSTTFVITHNIGTRDVEVHAKRSASPYETVYVDVERTTTNSVTVRFAGPPTTNEYMILIAPVKP